MDHFFILNLLAVVKSRIHSIYNSFHGNGLHGKIPTRTIFPWSPSAETYQPVCLNLIVFFIEIFFFSGKILNDDQPVSEYKIDEKGFVVVMVTKVSTSLFSKTSKRCCFRVSKQAGDSWEFSRQLEDMSLFFWSK